MKSEVIALSAPNTLRAVTSQLSTARATRLTLRLPLLLLLALPAVAQAQLPFITQDAFPITGYTSLAYGDAVTIPSTANGHRVSSIEFQGFDNGLHDLLQHYRIRTGRRFNSNFQNDFAVACNCPIPLNASGIVAAKHEAVPPVMFLSAAIARGPPWSGNQNLYVSDDTPVLPAPRFCTAPLLSEFQLHASSLPCNATRLLIQSLLASGAGASLVEAISQSNTTQPFTSRSYYEIQL